MTWLDMQTMRQIGGGSLSPDGKWLAYALNTPDWKEGSSQSDLYVVSTVRGVPSTKQLTSTPAKNETRPKWTPDGKRIVFVSNRDAAANAGPAAYQLYVISPDSSEPRKVSDAPTGVSTFDFTPDGTRLVFRSGRPGAEQVHALATADLVAGREAKLEQLTKHPTGISDFEFSPDGKRIYFLSAEAPDPVERARVQQRFTMEVRDVRKPVSALWAFELGAPAATRLTSDSTGTVVSITLSGDGRWIAFRALPDDAQKRRQSPEQQMYTDLYLLETATGQVERLTNNSEVGEGNISFSPDSRWVAFGAPDDLTRYSMTNGRVYLRRVDDRGGQWRKLGAGFDGDVGVSFWSADGRTIYFNEGVRATNQLLALDVERDQVRAVTNEKASINVSQDERTKRLLINYSDPRTPDPNLGSCSIQVNFRDWIGPWLNLDFFLEMTPLVNNYRDIFIGQVGGNFRDTLDRFKEQVEVNLADKGILGKQKHTKAIMEAIGQMQVVNPPPYLENVTQIVKNGLVMQQATEYGQVAAVGLSDQPITFQAFMETGARAETKAAEVELAVSDRVDAQIGKAQEQLVFQVQQEQANFRDELFAENGAIQSVQRNLQAVTGQVQGFQVALNAKADVQTLARFLPG